MKLRPLATSRHIAALLRKLCSRYAGYAVNAAFYALRHSFLESLVVTERPNTESTCRLSAGAARVARESTSAHDVTQHKRDVDTLDAWVRAATQRGSHLDQRRAMSARFVKYLINTYFVKAQRPTA